MASGLFDPVDHDFTEEVEKGGERRVLVGSCRGILHAGSMAAARFRGMSKLDQQQRDKLGTALPEWKVDGEVLRRTFEFSNFTAAMGFVTKVAILAEKANHHPDIDIRWNKVTLALTTHDAGGLSEKDVSLATTIRSVI